ncbi:MAG: chemotaxis protein CheW [Defluviitaleaceae bacterium]|nr:chemotaxis protein CheW [Defluviitaleaceae bacterium]
MDEKQLSGMKITVSGRKFILPIPIIKRSFKAAEESVTCDPSGDRMINIDEGVKSLINLSDYLDLPPSQKSFEDQIVMVLEDKRRKVCVCVDSLVGECKAEIYPLPAFCGDGEHIAGCAILSDGEIFLVINHDGLFEGIEPDESEEEPPPKPAEIPEPYEPDNSEMDDKYLTFEQQNEVYAFHIAQVKEIISVCEIVPVPKAPRVIEGVINRRGDIIPVMDLNKLFSGAGGESGSTSIIILEYEGCPMGVLIDKINETITLNEENISPVPQKKAGEGLAFVNKLGRYNENVILILDLVKVFEAIH